MNNEIHTIKQNSKQEKVVIEKAKYCPEKENVNINNA